MPALSSAEGALRRHAAPWRGRSLWPAWLNGLRACPPEYVLSLRGRIRPPEWSELSLLWRLAAPPSASFSPAYQRSSSYSMRLPRGLVIFFGYVFGPPACRACAGGSDGLRAQSGPPT